MTWIVIGCGYTGGELVRLLAGRGEHVIATRRDPAAAASVADELGVAARGADLADPSSLTGLVPAGAVVVCLAPPGSDPAAEAAHLAAACAPARRLIYVSSTAVYPRGAGGPIDETCEPAPFTSAGRARLAFERALAFPHVALRAAGIWGPGRGLVDRIRAGTYRIVGDDRNRISRIHVADVAQAIARAGASPATGAINLADDDPAPIGEVADALADALGVARAPRVAEAAVPAEVAGMLAANRMIANGRMKRELGVVLAYPSWRSALPPPPA